MLPFDHHHHRRFLLERFACSSLIVFRRCHEQERFPQTQQHAYADTQRQSMGWFVPWPPFRIDCHQRTKQQRRRRLLRRWQRRRYIHRYHCVVGFSLLRFSPVGSRSPTLVFGAKITRCRTYTGPTVILILVSLHTPIDGVTLCPRHFPAAPSPFKSQDTRTHTHTRRRG